MADLILRKRKSLKLTWYEACQLSWLCKEALKAEEEGWYLSSNEAHAIEELLGRLNRIRDKLTSSPRSKRRKAALVPAKS